MCRGFFFQTDHFMAFVCSKVYFSVHSYLFRTALTNNQIEHFNHQLNVTNDRLYSYIGMKSTCLLHIYLFYQLLQEIK